MPEFYIPTHLSYEHPKKQGLNNRFVFWGLDDNGGYLIKAILVFSFPIY
jgi:hypothetical protein